MAGFWISLGLMTAAIVAYQVWLAAGPPPRVRRWAPRPLTVNEPLYSPVLASHWRELDPPAKDEREFVSEDGALSLLVFTVAFPVWPHDLDEAVALVLEDRREDEDIQVGPSPWGRLVERWIPPDADGPPNAAAELVTAPGVIGVYVSGYLERAALEAARAEVLAELEPVTVVGR